MSDVRRVAHDSHDLELVSRAAAGDLAAGEVKAAGDLLAACEACAALADDLRAIAAATRDLGSAERAAPGAAPRDFRLTEADVARLRPGFRGLHQPGAWLAGRGRGFGGALVTLGLVGLLVSAGLSGLSGGAAGGAASQERGSAGQKDNASIVPAMGPAASGSDAFAASGDPARSSDLAGEETSSALTPPAVVAVVSAAILVVGLAFLLVGRARRRAGP